MNLFSFFSPCENENKICRNIRIKKKNKKALNHEKPRK